MPDHKKKKAMKALSKAVGSPANAARLDTTKREPSPMRTSGASISDASRAARLDEMKSKKKY